MKQIYTYGTYLKKKFGVKVYKVGINISGFTCPNIDGTVAKGGCTFCENDSFSASTDEVQELKGFHLNLSSTTNPFLDKQLLQLEQQFTAISSRQKKRVWCRKVFSIFSIFYKYLCPSSNFKNLV